MEALLVTVKSRGVLRAVKKKREVNETVLGNSRLHSQFYAATTKVSRKIGGIGSSKE